MDSRLIRRRDLDFLLFDLLDLGSLLARSRFAEHSVETFAAVLDTDAWKVAASEGDLPDPDALTAMALQAMSPPPDALEEDGTVATAFLVSADLILVVGRSHPVLRDRERQWISIMAELADHGFQELA